MSYSFKILFFAFALLLFATLTGQNAPVANESSIAGFQPDSAKRPLYLLAMAPYPDSRPGFNPSWEGGPAVIPGAILAVKHVNNRSDVLRDFELKILPTDSGCQVVTKMFNNYTRFLFHSQEKDHIVGIIGPGCSAPTIELAHLLARDKLSLLQISPSATSPVLTDNTSFPNTFRPIASALGFVTTLIELIKKKNYTTVGALYETQRVYHNTVYTRFESEVKALETKPDLVSFGISSMYIPLDEIENKARVVFVIASTPVALKILCLAFHRNMLFPDYQWIFIERRLGHFTVDINITVTLKDESFSCTPEQMNQTTKGIILNLFRLTRKDKNFTTDSGFSYNAYLAQYKAEVEDHLRELPGNMSAINTEYNNAYYDATWAFALSLNNSIPCLNDSLSTYKYGQPEVTKIIREQLLALEFEGMVGKIKFSAETLDGTESTIIDIFQVVVENDTPTTIFAGRYSKSAGNIILQQNIILIEDIFEENIFSIPLGLGVSMLIVAGFLATSTAVFQLVTALHSNYKFLKATSPQLNHVIFSGCYLYLIAAILYTGQQTFAGDLIDKPIYFGLQCSSIVWCMCMGYSLIFATVCAKTWRIHRIFNHFSPLPVTLVSDPILMTIVLTFLSMDVIVIFVWNLLNPWRVETTRSSLSDGRVTILAFCNCDNHQYWIIGVTSYKVLLTVIVLYLSIATRNVNKKEFKQTKTINFLVYSLTMIYGIFIPVYVILFRVHNYGIFIVSYCCLCCVLLGSVIACSLFIFLPPTIPFLNKSKREFYRRGSSFLFSPTSLSQS